MVTVLLAGFGHPESVRLVGEMRSRAPQHTFADLAEGETGSAAHDSAVALVWCPRGPSDAAALITKTVADGFPTVALLQDHLVPEVDFNSGNLEFAFLPVRCDEALARIALVTARARGPVERNMITHGDLVIDQDRYEVTLAGRKIELTYKEYELLKYIAARPGRVFSREALLRAVWDYDYFGGTRTVDVHVRRLRSKINDVRYQFIETVWNVGYRFRASGEQSSQ